MSVVIAVHGTFASGPLEGDGWWQTGGPLEADIKRYVRAQPGEIRVQPFAWDGANSEASRWKAARSLFELALSLEKKGEPYCMVGHSHGGSVIAYMLSLAMLRGNRLPNLSMWSTIGSPFMTTKPSGFIFNRLLPYEKLILLATSTGGLLAFLLFSLRATWPNFSHWEFLACTIPAVVALVLLWYLDRTRQFHTRDGHMLNVSSSFATRGLCFYHANDEAINSLANAAKAKLKVFDSRFLTGISLSVVLALTPVLFFLSFGLAAEAFITLFDIPVFPARSIVEYADRWTHAAGYVGSQYTDPFLFALLGPTIGYNVQLAMLVLAFVAFCFVIFALVGWVAGLVSRLLAERLNSLASFHVAQAAYGSDGVGTTIRASGPNAFDGNSLSHRLPLEIELSMQRVADKSASERITELRRKLGELVASIGDNDHTRAMGQFLTWNELIHTTYFAVPELRMLLCCAISRADGFSQSEHLGQDARSSAILRWLAGLSRTSMDPFGPLVQE